MKKSLFLYLFILSALLNVFTYAYFTKKEKAAQQNEGPAADPTKDSLNLALTQLSEANYFALENNQNAQNYFASDISDTNLAHEELIPLVQEKLLEFNNLPAGNPYTGQSQLGEKKFIINKARLLNHRWIVADFSDGDYWGEVLLKYFVNKDNSVSFEVIQSLVYQK